MKNLATQKVKDLRMSDRRTLEAVLGRTLQDTEEVTVLASRSPDAGDNGREKSCYDLAKSCKMIGVVKNAPADLSTSKAYFDGFDEE